MREATWIEGRIRQLEAEVAAEEASGEVATGPDRRFLLGALHHKLGKSHEASRWYLSAARTADGRGERAAARALAMLARELAPESLEAAREFRRLAAAAGTGMDG